MSTRFTTGRGSASLALGADERSGGGGMAVIPIGETIEAHGPELTPREAWLIGIEAYERLCPLVLTELARHATRRGLAPEGRFVHVRAYPGLGLHQAIRPDEDALYSFSWIDLGEEPYVLSLGGASGSFDLLPLYPISQEVFASLGVRATGAGPGEFIILPRDWPAAPPDGMTAVDCPTRDAWVVVRTRSAGPRDRTAEAAAALYALKPLSEWRRAAGAPLSRRQVSDPVAELRGMSAGEFFAYAAELLGRDPGLLSAEPELTARLSRIGLSPGAAFDFAAAPAVVQAGLAGAVAFGRRRMGDPDA